MRKWLARRRMNKLHELVTGERERDWRMGLCFVHAGSWHLAYRVRGGFGRVWLPQPIKTSIADLWNPVVCHFRGHEFFDEREFQISNKIICTMCSREWLPDE